MKRTIAGRARFHIVNGIAMRDTHAPVPDGQDYKEAAAEVAAWILKSAKGDPKARALLVKAGVHPDTPRATLEVIRKGV
jgi:hypothetical protein